VLRPYFSAEALLETCFTLSSLLHSKQRAKMVKQRAKMVKRDAKILLQPGEAMKKGLKL